MKYKKSLKNTLKIFTLLVTIVLFLVPVIPQYVYAQSSTDLNAKLTDLNQQLQDIKAQKAQIDQQIANEKNNQSSLASQISLYDSKIQLLQLTIQEKQKTIEQLETQIALTQVQIKEKEANIKNLEDQLAQIDKTYKERIKTDFQDSFTTGLDTFFNGGNFDDLLIQNEFSSTLKKQSEDLAAKLEKDKEDLQVQKDQLNADLKTQQDMQDQVKAETVELGNQEVGLDYQKQQKEQFLVQSKQNQQVLQQKQAEIMAIANQKQKELDDYLLQVISVRGSGSAVHKGDVIGRMGRSGYVLTCTGSYCYYPDPDKEPCGGAHLHFEVAKNDGAGHYYRTNPLPYVQNGLVGPPLNSYWFTGYYLENPSWYSSFYGYNLSGNLAWVKGHPGIDFVGDGNCGTPIYAGSDGVITYRCAPFQYPGYRRDDTFFAVLYDPVHDINITYMHLQKAPGVCPA